MKNTSTAPATYRLVVCEYLPCMILDDSFDAGAFEVARYETIALAQAAIHQYVQKHGWDIEEIEEVTAIYGIDSEGEPIEDVCFSIDGTPL